MIKSDMNNEELMECFVSLYGKCYFYQHRINEDKMIKDSIKLFGDIVNNKIIKGIPLSELENSFKIVMLSNFFNEGGRYSCQKPKNIESPFKELAGYYLNNFNKLDYDETVFCMYYLLGMYVKEYNLKIQYVSFSEDSTSFDEVDKDGNKRNVAFAVHNNDSSTKAAIIRFNPKLINEYIKNHNPFLLEAMLHELRHEYQKDLIDSFIIRDPQSIIWLREKIVRDVLGNKFYETNYFDIFHERDARYYSLYYLEKYLKELGVANNICDLSKNKKDGFDISVKHVNTDLNNYPTDVNLTAVDTLDVLSTAIMKDSNYRKYCFRKYPLVKSIYREDGSKKPLFEVYKNLDKRCIDEISKGKEDSKDIKIRYSKLKVDLAKIDSDYYFQYLCMKVYDNKSMGRDNVANTYVAQIEILLKRRELSYDLCIGNLERYIINIEIELSKSKFDLSTINKDRELREEILRLKGIKRIMMDLNSSFINESREKHKNRDIQVMISKYTGESLSLYDYTIGPSIDGKPSEIRATMKSDDDILLDRQRYIDKINSLRNVIGDSEADSYIEFINNYFVTSKDRKSTILR